MSEIKDLTIQQALMSYVEGNATLSWYNKGTEGYILDYLAAGRSGTTQYYFTRLEFNTNDLNFTSANDLNLKLFTYSGVASNPYGITAIISSKKLSENETSEISKLHSIVSEDELQEDYFLAYANCSETGATVKEKIELNFDFIFTEERKLQVNQTYFIYIKRRLGLPNIQSSKPNGFTGFYNPIKSQDNYSLRLTYSGEPTYPSNEEVELIPKNPVLKSGTTSEIAFSLNIKDESSAKTFEGTPVRWSIEVYNVSNDREEVSWASISDQGLLSISEGASGKPYKIKVMASWGSGAAVYNLSTTVTLQSQWIYLDDWIAGYNLGLAAAYKLMTHGGG